jgi:hypothetical protein
MFTDEEIKQLENNPTVEIIIPNEEDVPRGNKYWQRKVKIKIGDKVIPHIGFEISKGNSEFGKSLFLEIHPSHFRIVSEKSNG